MSATPKIDPPISMPASAHISCGWAAIVIGLDESVMASMKIDKPDRHRHDEQPGDLRRAAQYRPRIRRGIMSPIQVCQAGVPTASSVQITSTVPSTSQIPAVVPPSVTRINATTNHSERDATLLTMNTALQNPVRST